MQEKTRVFHTTSIAKLSSRLSYPILFCIILISFFTGCAGVQPEKEAPREEEPAAILEVEPYESISASMSAGNPEEAVEKFEEAYSENPESIETQLLYSSLLITTGQVKKAEAAVKRVLEREPDNTDALYNLALINGMKNNREAQKALLEKVVSLDSTNAAAHAALGELLLEDQKLDEAEEQFEKSIQHDEDNFVARTGYGHVLLRKEQYAEAEEQLDEAVRIQPDYPFAYVDRAKARSGTGNINGALEDLSAAIELDPDHYWNYIDRGKLYLHVGNMEAALGDFSRAIEIDPEYFLGYVYTAGILHDQGKKEEAFEGYRKLISLREDYYPAYEPLALIAYSREMYNEAAVYFRKHYERNRKDHGHALMAGISYLFAGEKEKGIEYIKAHMDTMPRETYMYDIARLFTEKRYDNYFTAKIVNEENITIRIRALFYLATYYKLNGEVSLANTYFLEVEDANIYGLYETDLAIEELSDKIVE